MLINNKWPNEALAKSQGLDKETYLCQGKSESTTIRE